MMISALQPIFDGIESAVPLLGALIIAFFIPFTAILVGDWIIRKLKQRNK